MAKKNKQKSTAPVEAVESPAMESNVESAAVSSAIARALAVAAESKIPIAAESETEPTPEGHVDMASQEAASDAAPEAAAEATDEPPRDSTKITNFAEIEQALESLIFASTRPISLIRLRNAMNHFNYDTSQLVDALKSLEQKYESTGFQLVKVAGGYQFRSHPKSSDLLQKILEDKPAKLSVSALEVLAIVAYKQPVTRSEIDAVRGIDSGHLMKGLLEKNLVRTVGHAESPGRPMLFGTTNYFLEVFGLDSLDDLPALDDLMRELGPEADVGGSSDGTAEGESGVPTASEDDAAFFDGRPSVLAAEPDRGAFDEPAEDRVEKPDFGEAHDEREPEAQA